MVWSRKGKEMDIKIYRKWGAISEGLEIGEGIKKT